MTPQQCDVSVIIPFYNREKYIDQAIESVLAQTVRPLEIILVNDYSRESSRRYLDRFANVCRIVDLPVNVGLAGSRNAGIRAARGRFVALLDDDDIWLPEKLQKQCQYMEDHPECSVVHTAVWAFFSDKPDELWKDFGPPPLTLPQALTHNYWAVPSTLLIRSHALRAVGGFDERFRENEDRDFMIRCAAAGYRMEGIPEPLARMRREGHACLTKNHMRMYLVHVRLCWIHRALFYRVYGIRGILNFLLSSLHLATRETRYVDGFVRKLLKIVNVKWRVRSDYREPKTGERGQVKYARPEHAAEKL
jgi:glycosyltransferase involved in cell wall biosynthesis